LPVETLFELNAALDHISRHWAYDETEASAVEKAYAHLKRSCLDVFKLKVKDANIQFTEIRGIDTSILDNGQFDLKLIALYHKIKSGATDARHFEGESRNDDDSHIKAFDRWEPVYQDCILLEKEFYNHASLPWAKKKIAMIKRKEFWGSIFVAFIVGLITPTDWFQKEIVKLWHRFCG
jgi:hypothetical protein